jgi:hypothetical protein
MAGISRKHCDRMKGMLPCSSVFRCEPVSVEEEYEGMAFNADIIVIVHVHRPEMIDPPKLAVKWTANRPPGLVSDFSTFEDCHFVNASAAKKIAEVAFNPPGSST